MAARSGQKLKLLYIIEILTKYSDEEHPISATGICDYLSEYGVTAERKAIYDDIEQLIFYGYDIIKTRTPKSGYFLASRDFEIPEIYLLCDAVRTARFISAKKTRELTAKLDKMLSVHQQKHRANGIYISSSGKTKNEEIFYNIDTIERAIENHKKISMKYGVREIINGREVTINYKDRVISPYAMTWQDDHYYLIGNYDKYDNLIHLRIDRMKGVKEVEEPIRNFSEVSPYSDSFDVVDYTKRLFGMFGGQTTRIELNCAKENIEQLVDRFGEDIFIRNITDTHFTVEVDCAISEALVTWIMNYGVNFKVLKPQKLRDMIKNRAESILNIYKE